MRYRSKDELVEDIIAEHGALLDLLRPLDEHQCGAAGVWGDGWSVCDLLAHLAEWHRMLLTWFAEGERGENPAMPSPGYTWRETPRLNRAIWEKHRGRSLRSVRGDFESTYREVLQWVHDLPEEDLLQAGRWHWAGKNPLVTYVGANTASHYRFAQKVIKRWRRGVAGSPAPGGRA